MTTFDDVTHVVALSEDSLASNGARPSSDWLSTDYKITYVFQKKNCGYHLSRIFLFWWDDVIQNGRHDNALSCGTSRYNFSNFSNSRWVTGEKMFLDTIWHLINWPLEEAAVISNWTSWNSSLQWRHNGRDGLSNHQPHDCLLNRLFGRGSKKTSKLCVTGLFARNSPGTGEFPAQMTSYAEIVSIWWRHHVWNIDIFLISFMNSYPIPGTVERNIHWYIRDISLCLCIYPSFNATRKHLFT